MELISEYLAADTSPDASADALAIINIGKLGWLIMLYHQVGLMISGLKIV